MKEWGILLKNIDNLIVAIMLLLFRGAVFRRELAPKATSCSRAPWTVARDSDDESVLFRVVNPDHYLIIGLVGRPCAGRPP